MSKKEGDTKACVDCGETMILKKIRPPDAYFVAPDGSMPEPPGKDAYKLEWQCQNWVVV